jgi:zinc transporter ZupT
MEEHKIGKAEVFCSMFSSILGALSFIVMNRFLGGHEGHGDGHDGHDAHGTHVPLQEIGDDDDEDDEEDEEDEDEEEQPRPSRPLAGAMPAKQAKSLSMEDADELTPRRQLKARSTSAADMSQKKAVSFSKKIRKAQSQVRFDVPAVNTEVPGPSPAPLQRRARTMLQLRRQERAGGAALTVVPEDQPILGSTRPLNAAFNALLNRRPSSASLNDPESRSDRSDSQTSDSSNVYDNIANSGAGGAAMAIWLGLTMDGVPEAMVIGILANNEVMSMALVVGVFLANFPEAIATGAMMKEGGMPIWKNMMLWTSLCIMTGLIAMLAAVVFPRKSPEVHWLDFVTSSSEGLAAGAMLAMISGTMLPDAYQKGGADLVGFWTVAGFVSVLAVKVCWPAMPEVPAEGHDGMANGHH